jgi:prevent-host-death family protein
LDKTVNIHTAKTHLSSLIAEAEAGQDIVIARAGKPAVKLVPVKPNMKKGAAKKAAKPKIRADRKPGFMKGKIWIGPDFDDPLPEHILAAFRGERD